jgi:hypothetical protein
MHSFPIKTHETRTPGDDMTLSGVTAVADSLCICSAWDKSGSDATNREAEVARRQMPNPFKKMIKPAAL